jgi:hypothetical protein
MTPRHSLDQRGAWLIAGSVLFLVVVASLVAWQDTAAPHLDPVTLCDPSRPLTGEVVVLLDVTDPLTPEQQGRVTEWLREFELTELRPNERVSLWLLGTAEGEGLAKRFCRCYPGRESDPILHNPAMVAATGDSFFTDPLRHAIEAAAGTRPSQWSRILEAIRELSEQPEVAGNHRPRRLIVISDLEQNAPGFSCYRSIPDFAAFSRSPLFSKVRADLRGVAVDVLYLSRGVADVSAPELREFWRSYLALCGATAVHFRRL